MFENVFINPLFIWTLLFKAVYRIFIAAFLSDIFFFLKHRNFRRALELYFDNKFNARWSIDQTQHDDRTDRKRMFHKRE